MKSSFKNKNMLFIAVRLKSSRLKKKALKNLHNYPLLQRLVERIETVFCKSKIVICTSVNKEDDDLEFLAKKLKIHCFRGSELDVMKRFIDAASRFNVRTIARITGDNPLTDPIMLKYMFEIHEKNELEYTYNDDLPIGTRSEIINVKALHRIHDQIYDPNQSEYMTYMLKRPDKMNILEVPSFFNKCKRPEISLTVDNTKDLKLIRKIYDHFQGSPPSLQEILEYLDKNPKLKIIHNANVEQHKIKKEFSYKDDSI